jgi:hypothetical protein
MRSNLRTSLHSLDFAGHYDPAVEDARLIGAALFLHGGSSRPPVINQQSARAAAVW